MKLRITLKDPDGVSISLDEAVRNSLPDAITDKTERSALFDLRYENLSDAIQRWVDCSEYVTIEIDTDAKTARVVEQE